VKVHNSNAGTTAPRQTLGARRLKMRVMRRPSVGIVAVYEQEPPLMGNGKRALVFESARVCTRVLDYPDDWQRLSDDELSAIRHQNLE
jgi:hypothetical protein